MTEFGEDWYSRLPSANAIGLRAISLHHPGRGILRLDRASSPNDSGRTYQGQTSDFAREGLGKIVANGTVPLSRKISV